MVEDLIKRLRNWRDTHLSGLAREAADLIEQQAARIAELEAAIRKQANAARSLADATIRDASIRQGLAEKAYAESSPEVLASERQANAMLTEENERLTARLTALESERDALLAAAGKQAVAWLCEPNGWNGFPQLEFTTEHLSSERWKKTPLYTAPTAALEKGDGRDAWISVEERLPEVSQLVLIAFPDGGIDFSFRHNHKGNGGWSGVNPKYHTAPTHWRVPPTTPAALSQKAGEPQ
jgi:hypothetical protein